MIHRDSESTLRKRLSTTSAVALLGSCQVGKTTLAKGPKLDKPTHCLDLERSSDVARLSNPEHYLSQFAGHLVILLCHRVSPFHSQKKLQQSAYLILSLSLRKQGLNSKVFTVVRP